MSSTIPAPLLRCPAWRIDPRLAAVFLAVLAVRLLYLGATGSTYEDALISLRYARNVAAGRGLVYNPGEHVFGASTPLYVLLLGALTALRLPDPMLAAKILSAAADALCAALWFGQLARETGSNRAGWLFATAFGLSPLLVQNSVAGMETSFALLFLTLAFGADRNDQPRLLGTWLGLLALVRPDALIAAGVILSVRAVRQGWTAVRGALAVMVLVGLPWVVFSWLYYGSPVPHSIIAKSAAYNAHRASLLPNLIATLNTFAPWAGPAAKRLFNTGILLLLLPGIWHVWRSHGRYLAVPLFWAAWWAYLVLPRTLLFRWYLPPLILAAYVLAAFGYDLLGSVALRRGAPALRRLAILGPPLALAACAAAWVPSAVASAREIQQAEETVRRQIGLWLAANTPPRARIAMEPIGYAGYYSDRRILDEIGLVSPEMVPFTRAGDGWFGSALQALRPDFVVERPYYVGRNYTLNSHVRMFATGADRAWFDANYLPVQRFAPGPESGLSAPLARDYTFVVYRRR